MDHHENPLPEAHQGMKRDGDSLDDFEHLGHDSSPLKDLQPEAHDLLGLGSAPQNTHEHYKIDNELLGQFARAGDSLLDQPLLQPQKMDNLLEDFPDRKEADQKLDQFLNNMAAPFKSQEPPKHDLGGLSSFLDNERGFLKDNQPELDFNKGSTELLDKYTDSEPESDDFKVKYDDIPKNKLPVSDPFKDIPPQPDFPAPSAPKFQEPVKEVPKPEPPKVEPPKIEAVIVQPPKPEPPKVEPPKPEPPKVESPKPLEKKVEKQKKTESKPATEKVSDKKPVKKIEAEALFCKMGLDAWFNPERLNPKVEGLIYWRDPKKSGPVFGGVLLVLLSLTYFSLISVVAYLSLIALTGTVTFRIYKNIIQAVQKTGDGHPFKDLLEWDISLSPEKIKELSEQVVAHANAAVNELRRLFLVEDLVDSIKFGVLLWTLTYLGAWFNGMTLIILAWVALFTLPKVYETNKTQIDANLDIVRTKLAELTAKVRAAVPIGKKSEEKKE